MLRGKMAQHRLTAAKALTAASNKLHRRINSAAKAALKDAKDGFTAKMNTLTNLVSANNKKYENGLRRLTGVVHSWKKSAGKERALLKTQVQAMNADLSGKIAHAIALGEAKAKAVEDEAKQNIKVAAQGLQTLASEKIERMANKVFKLVQGNRQKIADNYLSLKAYASTATDKITDYVAKGKGRGLGSVGDLLKTV